jgi:hypothetical protein
LGRITTGIKVFLDGDRHTIDRRQRRTRLPTLLRLAGSLHRRIAMHHIHRIQMRLAGLDAEAQADVAFICAQIDFQRGAVDTMSERRTGQLNNGHTESGHVSAQHEAQIQVDRMAPLHSTVASLGRGADSRLPGRREGFERVQPGAKR